ncbi:MAG: hypothetical protein K1X42_14105 [Opitutaceae bacterium]|nr:hypothetical protein [Opitutaceae bacterium]
MISAVNEWEQLVAARLLDFFDPNTPWHRSLWNPGLVLTLYEILEASEAFRMSILSEDALNFAIETAVKLAPLDPGVGDAQRLKALQATLRPKLRYDGLDFLAVRHLAHEIQATYLPGWAQTASDPNTRPKPERVARSIAAHLLDLGFSADYLHRWWTYRLIHEQGERPLIDIIGDAHALALKPPSHYEVLVTFESIPKTKSGLPRDWLDAPAVSQWLRTRGFETTGVRQRGGLVFEVESRDGRGAADAVAEIIDNLVARASIATSGVFRYAPRAWVAGEKTARDLRERRRGVLVRALYREDAIYSKGTPSQVDAAFELLAPLQTSSPTAAIAGGWAAIEALLSEPNDRGGAADRLAALVACSFPRAELTLLSYVLERADPVFAPRLKGLTKNRDRAAIVAEAIHAGAPLTLTEWTDKAALRRMQTLLQRPSDRLHDIQGHAAVAFRRLYRQRNLVLHGGKTNAVALRACLRTAAPLVGAGMDRIAHGWYVDQMRPLEVAARAKVAITTATPNVPTCCVDLLL